MLLAVLTVVASAQLAPPENLTAAGVNNNSGVKLTWEHPVTSNLHFNVYRKDAPQDDTTKQYRKIAYVHSKNFTDYHLIMGRTCSYYVTAKDGNQTSLPSNVVEFTRTAPVYAYGTINGFVTTDTTGAAIYRAKVTIFSRSSNHGPSLTVTTDSNGFFSARVKTGDYGIYTSAQGHFGEYFDNVRSYSQAATVTVAENDSLVYAIGLASVTPPVLYTVTGTVTDEGGLNPKKSRITVFVKNRNHHPGPTFGHMNVVTDSLGNFTVKARPGDTLALFAKPMDNTYKSEYWDGKAALTDADLIAVSGNVSGINFTLEPKPVYNNGVAGGVFDSAGTLGLAGHVYLMKKASNGHGHKRYWAATDSATGAYSFSNVEPGQYILLAKAQGYKASYFQYDGTPTWNWREADSVVVTESGVVSGINFNLLARTMPSGGGNASVVFGNTLDVNGAAVEGSLAYIVDADGNVVGSTVADPAGAYVFEGLGNGNYMLSVNSIFFADKEVDGIAIGDEANTIEVTVSLTPDGVTSVKGGTESPESFTLSQNYPNPFNPSTVIRFSLSESASVTLKVYNVIGQQVAVLVNGEFRNAGNHEVSFDASKLSNGVYIYRLETAGLTLTKKMTLLK